MVGRGVMKGLETFQFVILLEPCEFMARLLVISERFVAHTNYIL